MPPTRSRIWLNKAAVSVMELPPPHTHRPTSDGWEAEFTSPATVTVRFVHGGEQRFDLAAGDKVQAAANEFYVIPKASS